MLFNLGKKHFFDNRLSIPAIFKDWEPNRLIVLNAPVKWLL